MDSQCFSIASLPKVLYFYISNLFPFSSPASRPTPTLVCPFYSLARAGVNTSQCEVPPGHCRAAGTQDLLSATGRHQVWAHLSEPHWNSLTQEDGCVPPQSSVHRTVSWHTSHVTVPGISVSSSRSDLPLSWFPFLWGGQALFRAFCVC